MATIPYYLNVATNPKTYDKYTFKLSEKYRKMAWTELHENDTIREQALAQFREWIAKHQRIKRCRTDAVFLLRFLRTKKFSVPAACEMLENYLTNRQLFGKWFQNLDINDGMIEELIDTGYIVPLLKRDRKGRQIIWHGAGRFDPYKFRASHIIKVHSLVWELLMDDEESQIAGHSYIYDDSGITMGFISMWSLSDVKNVLGCIQSATPMRHKETHIVNLPSFGQFLLSFGLNAVSEKLRKRVEIHQNYEELGRRIDPVVMPREFDGEIPLVDLIQDLKKRLREKRDAILALDKMYIEVSKSSKYVKNCDNNLEIGSFRKLELD